MAIATKMKGGSDGEEFGFRLSTIVVGKDEDDDDETTCVIESTDASRATVAVAKAPGGDTAKDILDKADTLLGLGDGPLTRQVLVKCVVDSMPRGEHPRDPREMKVVKALNGLINTGLLRQDTNGHITK